MRPMRWLILGGIMLIASGVYLGVWRRHESPSPTDASAATEPQRPSLSSKWTGSPTCVGRSCHGGIEPRPGDVCRQDEYTTIAASDPHASAYRILFNCRSKRMAKLLGRDDGNAHEMPRCLACHATPFVPVSESPAANSKHDEARTEADSHRRAAEVAFGVGCESCHGPAESWLHEHYRKKPDKDASPATAKPLALDQPAIRAKACIACHVGENESAGNGARNVDHNLIAAGHPRLLFEFVAFNDALPAHWRAKPRDVTVDWFVGQLASAAAALDILGERNRSLSAPWPEFAEFDCFSCHHDLKETTWRQTAKRHRPAGVAPWNSWNADVIIRLLGQSDLPTKSWKDLRSTMEPFKKRDANSIENQLAAARAGLDQLAKLSPEWSQTESGREKLRQFLQNFEREPPDNWETSEQYYFAARALNLATDNAEGARWLRELEAIRGFDPDFVSPRNFSPGEFSKRRPLP